MQDQIIPKIVFEQIDQTLEHTVLPKDLTGKNISLTQFKSGFPNYYQLSCEKRFRCRRSENVEIYIFAL